MSDPQDPLPRASDDGRYRIGEVLGRGALATVVALTAPDGRPLAGKILHDSHGHDPAAAARFVQEAALLRRLDHPGIVRAQDTVTVGGRPMLVMERVDGPTLQRFWSAFAPPGEEFPPELLLRLKHMIVSHHGQYEYGSPKLPMTPEAVVLHYLDNLDAKMHVVDQLLKEDPNSESNWTTFHAPLSRKFFKGARK